MDSFFFPQRQPGESLKSNHPRSQNIRLANVLLTVTILGSHQRNLTMSNTAHSTGNMASAPPRPFVIEFISMHPHERFSRFEFQHYDRLLNSMTPSELQMAVSSMTSNELYAVSQEDQDEFQNPEFLVRLLSTNAVSRPSVDAYKDRRAYQRIKDVRIKRLPPPPSQIMHASLHV